LGNKKGKVTLAFFVEQRELLGWGSSRCGSGSSSRRSSVSGLCIGRGRCSGVSRLLLSGGRSSGSGSGSSSFFFLATCGQANSKQGGHEDRLGHFYFLGSVSEVMDSGVAQQHFCNNRRTS
jgi:hypothetical protein